jgi:Cu/Ag efflux pump CusA
MWNSLAQPKHKRSRGKILMLNSVLAALGIVLLLSVVMGNYRNLLLVLANLPFALVGEVLAAMAPEEISPLARSSAL